MVPLPATKAIIHTYMLYLLSCIFVGKWKAMLSRSAHVVLFISGRISKQRHRNWMWLVSSCNLNFSTNSNRKIPSVTVVFTSASFCAIGENRTVSMAWATTKITIKQQRENRTDLGKCSHQYDEKQGKNNNTQVLFTNCLLRVQEDRQQKKKGVTKRTD